MTRLSAVLPLTALCLASPGPAAAQEIAVAAGYTSMPGRIGSDRSDHGLVVRAGAAVRAGSLVRIGIEGAIERLNLFYQHATGVDCTVPGGGVESCTFDLRNRDVGLSLAATVRLQSRTAPLAPYALVGVGFLSVRSSDRQDAWDAAGNPLPNYTSNGAFTDGALQTHMAAGVALRPVGFPVAVVLEARATRLFHNYSGGLQGDWNQSVLAGVRWERGR